MYWPPDDEIELQVLKRSKKTIKRTPKGFQRQRRLRAQAPPLWSDKKLWFGVVFLVLFVVELVSITSRASKPR